MSLILVVINDSLLRFAVVSYLRFKGYSPIEAADNRAILGCVKTHPVDAVLLDVYPVSERIALLRELRLQPGFKHIPVIALLASPNRLEHLDELGPVEYLELPFDMPMLTWMLENLLVKHRLPRNGSLNALGA